MNSVIESVMTLLFTNFFGAEVPVPQMPCKLSFSELLTPY